MSNMRVRIAPSPSAPDLNLGNVRTALFNFLLAKKNPESKFIFRIEDSDTARSKPEYADGISETLKWLGLSADEGYKIGGNHAPYSQSEKSERYKAVVEELINKGHAYRCYCSQEELSALRDSLPEEKRAFFRYPGTCRDKNGPIDKEHVVRFKAPKEGHVEWDDLVFGPIKMSNVENFDWVLMRSSGDVLFNLACTVDDIDHKITHIVRGKDHLPNTLIQTLIYKALGAEIPKMAHLPMMIGSDNQKLTKRNASVSIKAYRDAGYTPGAILNYLARFGWSHGNEEIFSLPDLIHKFSLEACGKNDGKFDPKKFLAIQHSHLKNPYLTSDDEYVERLIPFIDKKGLKDYSIGRIREALPLIRPRAHTLVEAADEIAPFLLDEVADGGVETIKDSVPEVVQSQIRHLLTELQCSVEWNETILRQLTKDWLTKNNLSLKEVGSFMRLSLTGRAHSPELFQVMATLGRERSLKRLTIGVGRLGGLDNA